MHTSVSRIRPFVLALIVGAAIPGSGTAQAPGVSDWRATRAELMRSNQMLEGAVASPAYGERTKNLAREQLAVVRRRLTAGDFAVGDRLLVRVTGQTVNLIDTLAVQDSLVVDIPNVRRVQLYGVLRSEVEDLITREVGAVVLGATVRAQSLMRVAVLGEVVRPGYLNVPSETMIDQLFTLAGGPTATAAIENTQFVRGDTVLSDGRAIRAAIANGRTLSTLDVRDGDALVVPLRGAPWDRASTLQIVSLFIAPLITLIIVR